MKKICTLIICCLTALVASCSTTTERKDITGLWKSRDEKSDKPRSLVAIYKYKGVYYGRMLATYDEQGKIKDTILEKKEKSTGVVGSPPYCGMDFVYDVKEGRNGRYKGKIIDPQKGKVYDAEFWLSGQDLIVRGEVWIFGKNIPWRKASEKDLPSGFKMSDIKSFVPVIPKVS
ncbi:MAG: DUF2147 domain-containing protein [Verrucomicrobia bacterium]|jgi:uncharacterized protein (DUF2147 family)|nr:DUF2147 domain-containing protein [Verrucomicrobiota bacterium]